MLIVDAKLSTYTMAAGEPFVLDVRFQNATGAVVDSSAESYALSFYKSDREVVASIIGESGTDAGGQFFRFKRDGSLSESLYGKSGLMVELAERLKNGRNVIATGKITVVASALGVASYDNAPVADYASRVVFKRIANSAEYSSTVSQIPYVELGTVAPTLAALTLSTALQSGTAISGNILGATAGSAITGNIPGITINSGARTYSGTPTGEGSYSLVETLAGANGSPRTSSVTVAAANATPTPTPGPFQAATLTRTSNSGVNPPAFDMTTGDAVVGTHSFRLEQSQDNFATIRESETVPFDSDFALAAEDADGWDWLTLNGEPTGAWQARIVTLVTSTGAVVATSNVITDTLGAITYKTSFNPATKTGNATFSPDNQTTYAAATPTNATYKVRTLQTRTTSAGAGKFWLKWTGTAVGGDGYVGIGVESNGVFSGLYFTPMNVASGGGGYNEVGNGGGGGLNLDQTSEITLAAKEFGFLIDCDVSPPKMTVYAANKKTVPFGMYSGNGFSNATAYLEFHEASEISITMSGPRPAGAADWGI